MIGTDLPVRVDVVGSMISSTDYDEMLDLLASPRGDSVTVVAICNVHSVMTARRDPLVHAAIANADVATPDGMPLVWAMRRVYGLPQTRVAGPDLMDRALGSLVGARHFLYGGTEDNLVALQAAIRSKYPLATICGSMSPPFRELSDAEVERHVQAIRAAGATIVWVGLGMPKQELWMQRVSDRLPGVALVGVGAAFDFFAGKIKRAPLWMQRSGLEWLFRLAQEPRRMWRRYLWNNPLFALWFVRRWIVKIMQGGDTVRPLHRESALEPSAQVESGGQET